MKYSLNLEILTMIIKAFLGFITKPITDQGSIIVQFMVNSPLEQFRAILLYVMESGDKMMDFTIGNITLFLFFNFIIVITFFTALLLLLCKKGINSFTNFEFRFFTSFLITVITILIYLFGLLPLNTALTSEEYLIINDGVYLAGIERIFFMQKIVIKTEFGILRSARLQRAVLDKMIDRLSPLHPDPQADVKAKAVLKASSNHYCFGKSFSDGTTELAVFTGSDVKNKDVLGSGVSTIPIIQPGEENLVGDLDARQNVISPKIVVPSQCVYIDPPTQDITDRFEKRIKSTLESVLNGKNPVPVLDLLSGNKLIEQNPTCTNKVGDTIYYNKYVPSAMPHAEMDLVKKSSAGSKHNGSVIDEIGDHLKKTSGGLMNSSLSKKLM